MPASYTYANVNGKLVTTETGPEDGKELGESMTDLTRALDDLLQEKQSKIYFLQVLENKIQHQQEKIQQAQALGVN
jgi:hypothetical protein